MLTAKNKPSKTKPKPVVASTTDGKSIEEIYQKKSQLEHILLRPDTYIGSVEAVTAPMWVFENGKMVHRPVSYVPGLYKIFDEILVNASDNKVRDPSMDTLKINIDRENNSISVYNNGRGIPIEIHKEENIYVPELIFGHLLTSSNYDDNQKKVTGGRNGYGAKLCNIFSTEFIVETADATAGKKFKQVFSNNMSKRSNPVITETKKKENFTRITFSPDLPKFGMTHIDGDLEALLMKRAYDIAGSVANVTVYLNDVKIKVKDFKQYVDLYIQSSREPAAGTPKPDVVYQKFNDRWEIAVAMSEGQFQQVSFVNSICTSKGGTHVNYIADQMVTSLLEAIKKKDKKGVPLKPHQAKSHIWVFVNCLIENPAFDSQTKENMTLRASAFGSKCQIDDDFMKKFLKSGILETILSYAQLKQQQALKKSDGKRNTRISGLTKLDDANNAGTRNGSQCTLILTEGDSAKSLAVSGLAVIGRDNYGVFPLRGKLLNVREATHQQIMNNAEITAIKQIMGLQAGKVYTDTSSLRYGHIMIMTDQDHDGSHIKGLIINLLDHFWPSLMKIPKFLLEFITPIVKVTKKKEEFSFFTIPEYENWKEDNNDGKGWTIKYYKGLGTSSTADAKKYFSNLPIHRKEFKMVAEPERALVDMAFSKKKADDRKEWLRQYKPGTFMDHKQNQISISDFVNKELILFSMADNARSIPSVVDGLKPGQRKILFCSFKRNLVSEIKVAQFAGYVSEHSAYHHGEQSLCSTMVGMAQNFVGSNNVTLLEPLGQFGTRLQGGKDCASPRYIFTKLNSLARCIFHPSDDQLMNYLNDDGQNIEPDWYMPIVPMILLNGSDGIGTGWSTSIPNYNPRDVVENLFCLMDDKETTPIHPWYRGFKGEIVQKEKGGYQLTGKITVIDSTTVEITELPLRSWTQSYKEQLEEWLVGTEKQPAWITDFKEYHTDTRVHFVISLTAENLAKAQKEGLEKKFKMSTTIATTNMVCFDKEGRIRKYENVDTILKEFYELRLSYYQKRKAFLLEQLTDELVKLENKVRFILDIINGSLVVSNRKKVDILADLKQRKYSPIFKNAKANEVVDDDELERNGDHGFDYLLSMPIWSLTMEKVDQLKKDKATKENEVQVLGKQTAKSMWRTDLDTFLVKWDDFDEMMERLDSQLPVAKSGKKGLIKPAAKKATAEDDDFSDEPKKTKAAPKPKKAAAPKADQQVASTIDDLTSTISTLSIKKEVKKRAPKKAQPAKVPESVVDNFEISSDEEEKRPKAAAARKPLVEVSDSEEEEKIVVKKIPAKAAASKAAVQPKPKSVGARKVAAKKVIDVSSSNESDHHEDVSDFDNDHVVVMQPAKTTTAKKPSKKFVVSSDEDVVMKEEVKASRPVVASKPSQIVFTDDEMDEVVTKKPSANSKKPAAARKGGKAIVISSEDEQIKEVRSKKVAVTKKTQKIISSSEEDEKKPVVAEAIMIESSEEEQVSSKSSTTKKTAIRRPTKPQYVISSDEEEASEEESDVDVSEDDFEESD